MIIKLRMKKNKQDQKINNDFKFNDFRLGEINMDKIYHNENIESIVASFGLELFDLAPSWSEDICQSDIYRYVYKCDPNDISDITANIKTMLEKNDVIFSEVYHLDDEIQITYNEKLRKAMKFLNENNIKYVLETTNNGYVLSIDELEQKLDRDTYDKIALGIDIHCQTKSHHMWLYSKQKLIYFFVR